MLLLLIHADLIHLIKFLLLFNLDLVILDVKLLLVVGCRSEFLLLLLLVLNIYIGVEFFCAVVQEGDDAVLAQEELDDALSLFFGQFVIILIIV